MLHPGRYVPPDQQAIERQKALNQNPPGLTMAECELRALSGDRGYIPPTWYLATPPGAAVPPNHAIIIHRWDTETSQWIKLPLTKAGEDHEASQYSPHEWQLLVKLVWQTRKAQAQQGLQTHRPTTYKSLPAAQCLVTKVTSATPPDSDGWAQQLTNHTTSTDTFYLYLMKFPTTNDQKLLNDCKLAVDQVATALSQSPDPQAALLEYINTVLTHAQMLPYFQQHVVSQDILNQVQQANAMRTKQPQWKWEHLPKSTDPNTRVTIYHYQGCRYEWDPEHTKVLEHADVHQLIALTFCKVYLTRFLQLSFKAQRTWVRNIERGQSTCLHSTDLDDRLLQISFTEVNIEPHYTIHRRLSPGQQLPPWHHEWDQFRWALFWSFLWIILIVTIIHIHHKDHSFTHMPRSHEYIHAWTLRSQHIHHPPLFHIRPFRKSHGIQGHTRLTTRQRHGWSCHKSGRNGERWHGLLESHGSHNIPRTWSWPSIHQKDLGVPSRPRHLGHTWIRNRRK